MGKTRLWVLPFFHMYIVKTLKQGVKMSNTITFNANGGVGAPSPQTFAGSSTTLPTAAPTKAGYVFRGWSRNKDATEASYQAGDTYVNTARAANSEVALYAVYSLAQIYVNIPSGATLKAIYINKG